MGFQSSGYHRAPVYIYHGHKSDVFWSENSDKISKIFPKKKYWQLLFPARLIREKGINELITACDSLWQDNKNFRLYIAGEFN